MVSEWDLGHSSEIFFSLGDLIGHVGKCVEGFESVHERNGIGKRNAKSISKDGWNSVIKELCVANTWFYKEKEYHL